MSGEFLSYSREDREWVSKLRQALTQIGLNVWSDEDIAPGDDFSSRIESAIAAARRIIVVWSDASVRSDWVKTEANEGLERGVLVPVLKDRVQVPLQFKRIQAADLSTWQGERNHEGFRRLVAALGLNLSSSQTESDIRFGPGRVHAELVAADRYLFNATIRLILDRRVITIRHINRIFYQTLHVDGVEVARSGSFFAAHSYFQFFVEHQGRQLFLELRLKVGSLLSLAGVRLLLEEQEVLAEPVSWARGGWGLSIIAGALIFLGPLSYFVTPYLLYGPPSSIEVAPSQSYRAAVLQSYMVFFDWHDFSLSDQTLVTVKRAAEQFKAKPSSPIIVMGHTDTSEEDNDELSLHRAYAVRDVLLKEGIPTRAIVAIGRGTANPLVETGPHVREPQNRRVEILAW